MFAPGSEEVVGWGASVDIPPTVSNEAVFEVLKHKMKHPEAYLPVRDVDCKQTEDGAGMRCQMTLQRTGARVAESIYHDGRGEVRFIEEGDKLEYVNKIVTKMDGSRHLEFFRRDIKTGEKVRWPVPKSTAINSIHKCLDAAAALKPGEKLS